MAEKEHRFLSWLYKKSWYILKVEKFPDQMEYSHTNNNDETLIENSTFE